jgi:hypothetical protein
MPSLAQRRNRAYLNPLIERPAASAGLAVDLGGSVEWRVRRAELGGRFHARYDDRTPRNRRDSSLAMTRFSREKICAF